MSDDKKPDAAHAPSPFLPAMKMAALGLGLVALTFCFSLAMGFLNDGTINLERAFNTCIKLLIICAIALGVYNIGTDKPAEHH